MLFDRLYPKAEPKKTRRSAPFRVEELSRRIMLSDVGGGYPLPILPPPEPPPAETGGETP